MGFAIIIIIAVFLVIKYCNSFVVMAAGIIITIAAVIYGSSKDKDP